jgi:hypothetical protein
MNYGPRDAADQWLLPAIVGEFGFSPFTCGELFGLASRNENLAAHLLAADITSTKELGKLLFRLERYEKPIVLASGTLHAFGEATKVNLEFYVRRVRTRGRPAYTRWHVIWLWSSPGKWLTPAERAERENV